MPFYIPENYEMGVVEIPSQEFSFLWGFLETTNSEHMDATG